MLRSPRSHMCVTIFSRSTQPAGCCSKNESDGIIIESIVSSRMLHFGKISRAWPGIRMGVKIMNEPFGELSPEFSSLKEILPCGGIPARNRGKDNVIIFRIPDLLPRDAAAFEGFHSAQGSFLAPPVLLQNQI